MRRRGGAFLGTALGDHWAVALPFSEVHNPIFDGVVDRNRFPRTALLQAMVRFVVNDLGSGRVPSSGDSQARLLEPNAGGDGDVPVLH
jgi:hypothetical protein